jgi:hypothetical protein
VKPVRLSDTVELEGLAAEQWQELSVLKAANPRIAQYYDDLLTLVESGPVLALLNDRRYWSSMSEVKIISVECKSVTVLCYVEFDRVAIFWMSKLFRPLCGLEGAPSGWN